MSAQVTHKVTQATTTGPIGVPSLGRLRSAWYRICFIIQDMNYAARRVAEPQVSWSVDVQRHAK